MGALPSSPDSLELRAREQRQRIHQTALELISKVDDVKQKLTPSYNVRQHFLVAALIAAGIAMISGYGLAISWMRRR